MTTPLYGEGNTPLVPASDWAGMRRLYYKLELCNPTGSYKDRFIAAEMRRILSTSARACVATSSGNTGSSLAAYSARFGIRCTILVNEHAPAGKLMQMRAHGARVLRVRDFVTSPVITARVFDLLATLSADGALPLVISAYRYCPAGMQGVESIAAELCAQAGPDLAHVFVPVGGGGLFSAVARGFAGTNVRVHAVQPAGCLTVVATALRGDDEIRPVESTTRVSGLAVPFDIDASLALGLLRERKGLAIAVTDAEVFAAQEAILLHEGIYCEPAGAAALAGLRQALRDGRIDRSEPAVCLVTGHGGKDPASIEEAARRNPDEITDPESLEEVLMHA